MSYPSLLDPRCTVWLAMQLQDSLNFTSYSVEEALVNVTSCVHVHACVHMWVCVWELGGFGVGGVL